MIATINLPGSTHHRYSWVKTRKKGENWCHEAHEWAQDNHPAACPMPVEVMTDAKARKIKYRDGSKVYDLDRVAPAAQPSAFF